MKQNVIFLSFLFAVSFVHIGTLFSTSVQTPDGFKKIQALNSADEAALRLEMARQNHQMQADEVGFRQKVNNDNHKNDQMRAKDKELTAFEKEVIDRRLQEEARVISHYKAKAEIALERARAAQAKAMAEKAAREAAREAAQEAQKSDTESAFMKCLVAHKNSFEMAACGAPSVCEDFALTLAFLGEGPKVAMMVAEFKKLMKREL